MAAPQPQDFARRSFVQRPLVARGAVFEEVAGVAVAASFGDEAAEREAAGRLGLADLSPLPRSGFKGRETMPWLARQGIAGIDTDNMAYAQPDGSLVGRLAPGEVLILGDLEGAAGLGGRLLAEHEAERPEFCYPVLRREVSFWFRLTGADAAAMFAKICGVDLRAGRIAALGIAQTSVARTNCIVIQQDAGAAPGLHLLGDSASAEYMWGCLLDAMDEFDGRPVGLAALRALAGGPGGGG